MIFSDRQYQVSLEQATKFKEALAQIRNDNSRGNKLREIEIAALQSQLNDIESEIADYDLLKSGSISFSESYALADLPRALIQARIAQGLSQSDLAERLKMKPQQVQRYEATEYMSASLSRLIEIAEVLRVHVSQSFASSDARSDNALFVWSNAEDIDWTRFPLKEMAKRGWLKAKDSAKEARDFFLGNAGAQFATALHRKKVRSGNTPDEFALLAWQARVLQLVKEDFPMTKMKEFELTEAWIPELVNLTQLSDGPRRARDLLREKGVALVVERHLSGTYLDGAAMLSPEGTPIVALTLRYDRLDNFWFVLFHELGHVFLHLFGPMRLDFFDEEEAGEGDGVEKQADSFALEQLVPEAKWKQCLSRFALTKEAVLIDAEKLGIHPSIIAGRIRKERNNYTILNDLVGNGSVRSQLEGS